MLEGQSHKDLPMKLPINKKGIKIVKYGRTLGLKNK